MRVDNDVWTNPLTGEWHVLERSEHVSIIHKVINDKGIVMPPNDC